MKKFKNCMTVYLYVFIIFTSMLPTKENIAKISELKTILPGIEKIYNTDESNNMNNNDKKIIYSFKLLEIIQNII